MVENIIAVLFVVAGLLFNIGCYLLQEDKYKEKRSKEKMEAIKKELTQEELKEIDSLNVEALGELSNNKGDDENE